ncbi:MAG: hypothetical protein A3I24_00710 [Candidatus Harrisonbacteria bacterium RIFCSPLOWO2_02_FULL_41_13b]|uniref:Uncharacterized protein n=1 Tax=Candidatus Harrisonbacteria bacterium RIFCSPLOWO2_02_FULL_41_13b TaxID=1798409 RepID=A0A1G1ZVK2_9BACT|nr:MAG: hypothetical protein A3I24_00710 [Candidatus Harrisonbacteria bacterium RIFCSPLOWO2_02_FULL_41_13b]
MPIPIFRAWRVSRINGNAQEVEVACLFPIPGGGDPALRYLLSFVEKKGKLKITSKKFFNEFGTTVLYDGLDFSVPNSVYNPMARMARAILFERR